MPLCPSFLTRLRTYFPTQSHGYFGFTGAFGQYHVFVHTLFWLMAMREATRHHPAAREWHGWFDFQTTDTVLERFPFQGMRRHVGVLGVPRYLKLIKIDIDILFPSLGPLHGV